MKLTLVIPAIMTGALLVGTSGCSSDDNNSVAPGDDAGTGSDTGGNHDGGLPPLPTVSDPGPGGLLFAASGEVLALTGYPFPPTTADAPAFVDGWDVKFTRLIVTVDHIKISENPDLAPGDESQTGNLVAGVEGPWAVDLARSDPSYLPGKGGPGEQAVPIAALTSQNKNGNQPFKTDGTRYAFGFDSVAATMNAYNVNLDPAAVSDYTEMAANQCVVMYVGTATFKGDASFPGCVSAANENWPKTVNFRLCFKSPTTYVNCQNPDNDPADPFANEEHQRGIALSSSRSTIGQVTIHTDHPFWDSVLHDAPAHFDQFAARVSNQAGTPTVTLEMTKGVDYTAYTDATGAPVQWRYCIDPPSDVHPKLTGAMSFDPQSVPHATGNDPATGLRDYYDFATYNQSTQGHLNSDGLCFVKRNYPSPQ